MRTLLPLDELVRKLLRILPRAHTPLAGALGWPTPVQAQPALIMLLLPLLGFALHETMAKLLVRLQSSLCEY